MLHELPIECLQQIIGHLPSATAIINLALTNRRLHEKISADNYGVFQHFVQRSFPSIKTSVGWRDAAIGLTSRSRAWHRRGVIARECYPPNYEAIHRPENRGTQKLGYVPVIDSYEVAHGSSFETRKEVVAWAAGGKLNVRSTTLDSVAWQTLRFPHDHVPVNDILDLRLLRPHQCDNVQGERMIFRRATGEVSAIKTQHESNKYEYTANFSMNSEQSLCMEVSPARDPILALCDPHSIRLYPVHDAYGRVEAAEVFHLEKVQDVAVRQRCARFLTDSKIALAPQYLQGKQPAPIKLYDINETRAPNTDLPPIASLLPEDVSNNSRHGVNVLAPLDKVCGNAGQLFLSGWSDGVVRLHDTRTRRGSEMSYANKVDDGQILSLLPIGHQSFLAGSHQNGCLKTFDMRMPAEKAYSYLNARRKSHTSGLAGKKDSGVNQYQRDANFFLAWPVPHRQNGWKPLLSHKHSHRLDRYRSSVYSLSAPSPSSPTIYAGIEDHVIQLDLVASDDVQRGIAVDPLLHLNSKDPEGVLNLSCYMRPRDGFESTDPVLLNNQHSFRYFNEGWRDDTATTNRWDERWSLPTQARREELARRR